jgi:hypothetical protein
MSNFMIRRIVINFMRRMIGPEPVAEKVIRGSVTQRPRNVTQRVPQKARTNRGSRRRASDDAVSEPTARAASTLRLPSGPVVQPLPSVIPVVTQSKPAATHNHAAAKRTAKRSAEKPRVIQGRTRRPAINGRAKGSRKLVAKGSDRRRG